MSAKKILGERLEAGQFNENTSEHLHRYAIASTLCQNKSVLDIACGDGYGSNMLAKKARSVAGVDIDGETILLAREKYKKENLEYKQGSAARIPYPDNSFEIVVSFETLEHHDKHIEMMQEIKRVLIPGGVCCISTPDKLVYTDQKNYKNPFHVKELYREEFEDMLKEHFKNIVILKQQFFSGSLIVPDNSELDKLKLLSGNFDSFKQVSNIQAEYLIALASDDSIAFGETSIFLDPDFSKNKILQFQNSSLRYKVGKLILSPMRFLKKRADK